MFNSSEQGNRASPAGCVARPPQVFQGEPLYTIVPLIGGRIEGRVRPLNTSAPAAVRRCGLLKVALDGSLSL